MKVVYLFLFVFLNNSLCGQSIPFADYFPLVKGIKRVFYVSHVTNRDTIKDKNEYSICNSYVVNGKEIFFFDEETNSSDTTIIGSESFCHGVFFYDNGRFLFSPLFWKYELKRANLDYFEELFPANVSLDTLYKSQDGEERRKYKFIGFEDVEIKGKRHKDCLKLKINQDWKTAQYIDVVWFKKGFGVVKWLRGTGRLEEVK